MEPSVAIDTTAVGQDVLNSDVCRCLPGAEALPAVRWRLENLARLDATKRAALLARLGEVLGVSMATAKWLP